MLYDGLKEIYKNTQQTLLLHNCSILTFGYTDEVFMVKKDKVIYEQSYNARVVEFDTEKEALDFIRKRHRPELKKDLKGALVYAHVI